MEFWAQKRPPLPKNPTTIKRDRMGESPSRKSNPKQNIITKKLVLSYWIPRIPKDAFSCTYLDTFRSRNVVVMSWKMLFLIFFSLFLNKNWYIFWVKQSKNIRFFAHFDLRPNAKKLTAREVRTKRNIWQEESLLPFLRFSTIFWENIFKKLMHVLFVISRKKLSIKGTVPNSFFGRKHRNYAWHPQTQEQNPFLAFWIKIPHFSRYFQKLFTYLILMVRF